MLNRPTNELGMTMDSWETTPPPSVVLSFLDDGKAVFVLQGNGLKVTDWLYKIGLSHLAENFKQEGIEADVLPDLTNDDLKELGVSRLGDRKRLLKAIAGLDTAAADDNSAPDNDALNNDALKAATETSLKRSASKANAVETARSVLPAPPVNSTASPAVVHEAQRRQLTVMFCDLVGSTSLSTTMDPEDLRDLILSYQSACRKVILSHEGFISRYMGDGILVYFGYPYANEHSAESAVRASLEIINGMSALNHSVEHYEVDLSVRIGIATGAVVVGDLIGDGASEEAAVVGETPNLAARLQALADPNNVVISNATKKLAGAPFEYVDLGPQLLKGIASPVLAWQVLRESTGNWRHSANLIGDGTPLVDRRVELSTLMQCWNLSKAGTGQAVVIAAEAGMGKSRLVYAVEEQLAEEKHYLLRMQGVSFRRDTTLYPAIESVRNAAMINPTDAPEEQYQKLKELTRGQSVGDIETIQLIAPLFSLNTSDEFKELDIGPNQVKLLTLKAIWHRIEKLSEDKPVVVFIEDYHWIDPTTRELLDLAFSEIANSRVLLIITQRIEGKPDEDWSRHQNATVVTLGKLNAEDVHQLVSNMVAASTLPQHLQREIYRKTDGNPLFVEELTHMLLEQMRSADADTPVDMSELETGIPSTLHDLLLARLDQLGSARSLAQHAACYGRTFSRRGLEIIAPLGDTDLSDRLQQLLTSGLVHVVPDNNDLYEFKHALVQDAAYESQLKSTRVRIHQQIASHFEPELCDNEPEILAHHFGLAGNSVQERIYWHKAARRAMGSGAFVEAINYFQQALQALEKGNRQKPQTHNLPDHVELEIELLIESAVPGTLTKGWAAPEVRQAYERAHDLSQQQGSSPLLFAALAGIFRYYLVTGNYQLAEQVGLIDLERALQSGDESLVMEKAVHPGVVCYYTGRPAEALPYLKQSAELYDLEKHKDHIGIYGQCTATVSLSHQGKALTILGRRKDALAKCREAIEFAQQSGHVFSVAWGMSNHAASHILLENPIACHKLATSMIEISGKADFANWVAQGLVWQGWAIAHGGVAGSDTAELDVCVTSGLEKIHEGMAIWTMTGASLMQPFYFILLAQCHLLAGQLSEAESALGSSLEIMDKTGELWPKPLWRLTAEKVAVANGKHTKKQARDQSIKLMREYSGKSEWLWVAKAQLYINELDSVPQESPSQATHDEQAFNETELKPRLYEIAEQYSDLSNYPPIMDFVMSMKDAHT